MARWMRNECKKKRIIERIKGWTGEWIKGWKDEKGKIIAKLIKLWLNGWNDG